MRKQSKKYRGRISVPLRSLALIGAGYWGKNLARNFNALGALHTICDVSASSLNAFAYDAVQKTSNVENVFSDSKIRSIAIAAPAAQHFRLAKQALESGKDVFVEKPLCLKEEEGEELVRMAQKSGLILMVGHLLHYHPLIQKLQQLVLQGELGRLHYIISNRLNLGKFRREENALWSFAPHDLSIILSLAGGDFPAKVQCTGEAYLNDGVSDTTLTILRFADGLRAHAFVSWLNPFKEQKLTVVGSQGMAVFDDTKPWREKLILYRDYLTWAEGRFPTPNKLAGEFFDVAESEPLQNECAHFLECCRDRNVPRTDGHEGLRVLRLLQMAQQSLEGDGEAVSLTDSSKDAAGQAGYVAHPSAVVDKGAIIGAGSKVWHFSHVMANARIGRNCIIGQNVNIDSGASIGDNVKIQNNVSIYSGVTVEDDVFLGPSCVLTNVTNPRSQVSRKKLYERTVFRRGATVGANATVLCGVTLGRYCFIGAGAVVTKDVPDYALMIGNPARQAGWMSRHGHRLEKRRGDSLLVCPESGFRYKVVKPGVLRCLDLDENQPLPSDLAIGKRSYRDIKEKTRPRAIRTSSNGNIPRSSTR